MITVEQVHAFMEAINQGREAVGLGRIEKLEFDESCPSSPTNCLSARHLVCALRDDNRVYQWTFEVSSQSHKSALVAALGTSIGRVRHEFGILIPKAILDVTSQFDALDEDGDNGREQISDYDESDENYEQIREFRAVLVEAGVLDA